MANTTYEEIYTVFQSQFNDPTFNGLVVVDDMSKQYLLNAIPKFRKCLQNLNDRNDTTETFNFTLTLDEKLILGSLMVVEYLSPQIISLENLKQGFSSKEFYQTSKAAFLEKLLLLEEKMLKKVSKLIVDYTYTFSDLTTLR